MFAIGCTTSDERAFRASGMRTMQAIDEGSSILLRRHGHDSFDEPCNDMLAVAAAREDLEGMALVHQDTVTVGDGHVLARVRGLLSSYPDVAVIGACAHSPPREADAVTATLLVLSPWAVRNLRFDPTLGASEDVSSHDLSLQARADGRRTIVAPLGVARVWNGDRDARLRHLDAMVRLRRKWDLAPDAPVVVG